MAARIGRFDIAPCSSSKTAETGDALSNVLNGQVSYRLDRHRKGPCTTVLWRRRMPSHVGSSSSPCIVGKEGYCSCRSDVLESSTTAESISVTLCAQRFPATPANFCRCLSEIKGAGPHKQARELFLFHSLRQASFSRSRIDSRKEKCGHSKKERHKVESKGAKSRANRESNLTGGWLAA